MSKRTIDKTVAVPGAPDAAGDNAAYSRHAVLGGMAALTAGLAVGDLFALVGCKTPDRPASTDTSPRPAARPSRTITSGYIPILDSVPLIVAYEKGFYKEVGLQAEKP